MDKIQMTTPLVEMGRRRDDKDPLEDDQRGASSSLY